MRKPELSQDLLHDDDYVNSLIDYICQAASGHEIMYRLLHACSRFDYSVCSIAIVPGHDKNVIKPHLLLTTWPGSMGEDPDKTDMFFGAVNILHIRHSTSPLNWHVEHENIYSATPECEALHQTVKKFDISTGVDCSVLDPFGRRYIVSFAGNRSMASYDELSALNMLSIHAVNHFHSLVVSEADQVTNLTQREIECLRWTADGKTSAEIGIILGISGHTVNYYIVEAIRKLGASSRTQAVAMAIRFGMIK